MHRALRLPSLLVLLCLFLTGCIATAPADRQAVRQGASGPQALAGLLDSLKSVRDTDQARALISRVRQAGSYQGTAPAADKRYLRTHAPAVLLDVARRQDLDWTARSDALMALRDLEAPDQDLREAIAIARDEQGPEREFFLSRADLLHSWLDARGGRGAPPMAEPVDPQAEAAGRAVVLRRGHGISPEALKMAALEGDLDLVKALLDAGVPASTDGAPSKSPMMAAAAFGCVNERGDPLPQARLKTMEILVARGADPGATDSLGNTILGYSIQNCPLSVVQTLVELGADPSPPPNQQGAIPLDLALISGKWDIASFLVDRGARTSPQEIRNMFIEMPEDPAIRALLRHASGQADSHPSFVGQAPAARDDTTNRQATRATPEPAVRRAALAWLARADISPSIDSLLYAAMRGHVDQVQALLDAGVDPNQRDPADMNTPLSSAVVPSRE